MLYPQTGFTKGEVIDYYTRIAPVLLPHLADRPLTVKRYPNGVDEKFFFEKNAARGTPSWVRTVTLPVPGSTKNRDTIDYVVVEELATLVWLANLAALELHVPQWHVPTRARKPRTDLLVFDLDPGPPAAIEQCCEVALLLRDLLADDGITLFAKTSGSKGMQVSRRRSRPTTRSCRRRTPTRSPSSWRGALRTGRLADDEVAAPGQDPRRLEPEQPGEDDRGAVLAAGARRCRPCRRR